MAEPLRQSVARLRETIVRHEAAQLRIDLMVSPPPPVNDYVHATRQVLAQVTHSVVARVELWLLGERAITAAREALQAINTEQHRLMPFDLANAVSLSEVRSLAMDADEIDFSCQHIPDIRRHRVLVPEDPVP